MCVEELQGWSAFHFTATQIERLAFGFNAFNADFERFTAGELRLKIPCSYGVRAGH
jgi:hypothetical protein